MNFVEEFLIAFFLLEHCCVGCSYVLWASDKLEIKLWTNKVHEDNKRKIVLCFMKREISIMST